MNTRSITFETEIKDHKVLVTVECEIEKLWGNEVAYDSTITELIPNVPLTQKEEAALIAEGVEKISGRDEALKDSARGL